MKRMFLLLASGLLATAVAFAQDVPGNNTEDQSATSNPRTTSEQGSVIRGCLSGSEGNYTLTDQNGMQYRVTGDDTALAGKSGHEVEITARQDESSEPTSQSHQASPNPMSTVQVSDVREVASSCNGGNSGGMPAVNEQNEASPKGTPDPAEPPRPPMMARLQQQVSPGAGMPQSPASTAQQTSPPGTSQTPATPGSPTDTSRQSASPATAPKATTTTTTQQQTGSSPANNTGMTESEANHDAQAARQGELNTNPRTGETTGRGVDNQGANNPSTANPNAVPTSRGTANSSSNTQQPQGNANDQNKPLYERPATDIPWSHPAGENQGTPPPPH